MVTTAAALADPAKREIGVKIARAYTKGAAFIDANPEGALDIVCKAVPEECTDMNYAKVYFDEVRRYAGSYQPGTPYGAVTADGWETTVKVLADSGVIEGTVDPVAIGTSEASPTSSPNTPKSTCPPYKRMHSSMRREADQPDRDR